MPKATSTARLTQWDRQRYTSSAVEELAGAATGVRRREAALTRARQELGGPVVTDQYGRMVTLPDFTAQVQAGVALMDSKMPGWWRHIDTSSLDLQSENMCVLGQTWQHYSDGAELARGQSTGFRRFAARLFGGSVYDEHRTESAAHGFNISSRQGKLMNFQIGWERDAGVWNLAWEHLTETWLAAIRAKQEANIAEHEGVVREAYAKAVLEGKSHGQALLVSAQAVAALA